MNRLLPIFMKLENQPCIVVGGGKIAYQKIKQLLEGEADITVKSPAISEEIRSLPVTIQKTAYQKNDVDGYKLVIAATDDVINEGKYVTYDIGGNATTTQMSDAIATIAKEKLRK